MANARSWTERLSTVALVIPLAMVGALLAVAPDARARAQEPAVADMLARVTSYLLRYQVELAGVVSEETYEQQWYPRPGRAPERRVLRSDVLLTRPEGGNRYLLFRDVFEVDGRQVRDRDERLVELFLEPSASTSAQVRRILEESARYNVGDIARTTNTPTLALVFLDPQYRHRFRFERTADRVPEAVRSEGADAAGPAAPFAAPDDAWVVSYEEIDRNTLIGTGSGGPLPASGRYWIDPTTGGVLMTELILRDATVEALVDVRYDVAPAVGLLVPVAMRERYRDLRRNSTVEGSAAYTRVRRFQVTATETVGEPVP